MKKVCAAENSRIPFWSGQGETNAKKVLEAMKVEIQKEPLAKIDYIKCVNGLTMQQVETIKAPILVAMAVYIGKTRLIDNFIVE